MRRGSAATLATLTAVVVMLLGTRDTRGHTVPGGRTVVVQLDRREIALLVSWKPPPELARTLLEVSSAAPDPREHLASLYSARALAPLRIAAGGKALVPRSIENKLVVDPPGSGRLSALVLVRFDVPKQARAIAIENRDARETRIALSDRSGGRFEVAPALAGRRWSTGVASLLLTPRPGED
jgi:hypothetical protein